jgi:FkbM family methyltransferase
MKLHIFEYFKKIRRCYTNYITVILSLLVRKHQISVILRLNNKVYQWNNLQVKNYINALNVNYKNDSNVKFFPDDDLIEFIYSGRIFKFYGFLENGWVYNEFQNFEYKDLNFTNKIVIDIGANTGATSMYFALNGAERVYAVEPMPRTYELLVKNILINGFQGKIYALNFGIGKRSIVKLDKTETGLGARIKKPRRTHNSAELKAVEIKSLTDLINILHIQECVIKMDCEGCEYDALLDLDKETFTHIKEIILEYHNGCKKLLNYLKENGYIVTCTNYKNRIGILHAISNR